MAGGQATNSGIDYQQRIAAWCLINQYVAFDISSYFDQIDEELIIEKVHFETSNPIDDLNLHCKNNKSIFLQIKRSISLSERTNSEFYKTIEQFVIEFIKNENTANYFGLITTNDASSKITNDLKKIVVSVRLNVDALSDNPLNESEKDTLTKLEKVFNSTYRKNKGNEPTKAIFNKFIKRIFVGVVDIEAGHTVEIASFMLLKSIGFKRPELIWAILIKNSLIYASGRLSINTEKLKEIFDKYIESEKNKSPKDEQIDLLKTEIIAQGEYSTGKEVLLIKSFIEKVDFMIVELYRFKDDCQIKNAFSNNKVILGNGDEWTIIQRFSTMQGLDRYLEESEGLYQDMKIAVLPAREIETVEESECAKLHRAKLDSLLESNKEPLLCLHCGKAVGNNKTVLIEVEDRDTAPAVGNVHKSCLRPMDRVLGTIKIPGLEEGKHLDSFDYKLWISLLMKGQGMLNSLKSSPQLLEGRSPLISWNSKDQYDSDYSYCIKFNLEDGSCSYAYQRGRIERLNMPQAKEWLEMFQSSVNKQRELNDPECVLSISKTAGPYSEMLRMKKSDESLLEIQSVEITKYSKLIAKVFDNDVFFYAPLCLVRDVETETLINLQNVVPIISDPLQFEDYCKNWEKLGFEFDKLELKIIKSDVDFDNYMRMIFSDGMVPIIDPLFDRNFKLAKGYPLTEFNEMIKKMKEKSNKDVE